MNSKPSTTWSGVQRVQRDDALMPTVSLPPLMTLLDVYDLIPAEVRRKVSLKWLRKNLPNRRKLGGTAVWSSADVMDFLQNGIPLANATVPADKAGDA
ncbi:MAG: hypothetical protein ACK5VI_10680 [Opitutia bacterium]|jgi:hypothetical protein